MRVLTTLTAAAILAGCTATQPPSRNDQAGACFSLAFANELPPEIVAELTAKCMQETEERHL